MSIAKTLIQKEIERQERAIKSKNFRIADLKNDLKKAKDKKLGHNLIDDAIAAYQDSIPLNEKHIKELETDLKKL